MPKLVVAATVTVIRGGKRVTPKIGKAFNFTEDEAKYIIKAHPMGLRKPVVETVEEDEANIETTEDGKTAAPAKGDKPSKKGAATQKTAKAEKAKPAVDTADEDDDDKDADSEDEDDDI